MGFLDGLFRSVKREVENDIARKVTSKAVDAVGDAVGNILNSNAKKNDNPQTGAGTQNGASLNSAPSTDRYRGYTIGGGDAVPAESVRPEVNSDGSVIIDGIDYARIYNCDTDHFRAILNKNFPDMEIKEDVPLNSIIPGISSAYKSVSFLLSQGGAPKVVIQLRYPGQSTRVGSQQICRKNGIGYISLWTDYKNQEEYIVKRVKDILWS